MNKVKLFCFPYAGGSAAIYHNWQHHFSSDVKVIPIELGGRGRRIQEPLYHTVDDIISDVYDIISSQWHDCDFAFFGHSMGSMIVYQLVQHLRRNHDRLPTHCFFSGRGAPHLKNKKKNYHLMSDDEFKSELIRMGGTPAQFFEHPELIQTFYPLLRNDFRLAQTDFSEDEIDPIQTDITVFVGKTESLRPEEIVGWQQHTSLACHIHMLEGDHFFLHNQTATIAQTINNTLVKYEHTF